MLLSIWRFATVAFCYAAAVQQHEEDPVSLALANQARAASVGLKAVDRFLKGAVKDPTASMVARQLVYSKKGNIFKAFKDFYNVGVRPIRGPRDKGVSRIGTVGDRTVVIQRSGSEDATVTIFKTKEANNPDAVQTVIHYNKDGGVPDYDK